MKRQWFRAALIGLAVFVEGLMIYEGIPDTLDAFWRPAGQGLLAIVTALGVNVTTRRR